MEEIRLYKDEIKGERANLTLLSFLCPPPLLIILFFILFVQNLPPWNFSRMVSLQEDGWKHISVYTTHFVLDVLNIQSCISGFYSPLLTKDIMQMC